jgi:(2R)-ethylmalonyl-CoA mutase
VDQLVADARAEMDRIAAMGGAVAAIESGYMKSELVQAHAERRARVESGEQVIVGVNKHVESEPNPMLADLDSAIQAVDSAVAAQAVDGVVRWRAERDAGAVDRALAELRAAADTEANLVPASLACARVGVTTGEWADALRAAFGEFRAPTGVTPSIASGAPTDELRAVREAVQATGDELGSRLRFLVAKPGLDGHSNGAEQIAVRARDAGFEVIYQGIRLTPEQIVAAAVDEDVDVVGISILSGSHRELVPVVVDGLRAAGMEDTVVVVGGIIPDADADYLRERGVAAVFTPKDYDATAIMRAVLDEIRAARGLASATR